MTNQQPLPIQPVERPILNTPYDEPAAHWVYDTKTGDAHQREGRRPASYWFKTRRVQTELQMALPGFAEEEREDLPLVNALRADVKRWRASGYEGATQVTKQLLAHWRREDRPLRLFFCQLEAAETIIFLNEIRLAGKFVRFNPQADDAALQENLTHNPYEPLTRLGVKMATGSGKTVVMSMLIAWAFCNRGQVSSDERFPDAVLAVCPNLTIKERLQVLRPDHPGNYYEAFDLVPAKMRPLLQSGKVFITNWHLFAPESPHVEGGKSYDVVNKGPEGPEAFARRVLGDLYGRAARGGLMVLNDEAHHAWRPAPLLTQEDLRVDNAAEAEEATVWVQGLDALDTAVGVRFCVDLSATPFYIQGSGFVEGAPFPWLVSDFGLVDAIECGIVKIPRMPVSDSTGRPEPKYFRLWEQVTNDLQPGEKLSNGKPRPDVVYRKAEGALQTLASQWQERYEYIRDASDEKDKTPPVMIVVCDNTDLAEVFYRHISGEREEEFEVEGKRGKTKTELRTVYGRSDVLEAFGNSETFKPTVRIDTKMLEKAESGDPNVSRQDAEEQLRQIVATVGKPGEPGEQVRCVVSVAMLNEGWDANNVTHILGLRAFGSQLLCEQVVGRGLRRMDYTPDPETGKLTEEYVDIYGVPFSLIPFKGRKGKTPQPEDKPKNHVRALPERAHYEIKFPVVEGYAFSLQRNLITADIAQMEPLRLEPEREPTAVFVKPHISYEGGGPTLTGPGEQLIHDRQEYYDSHHLQTIKYEIARRVLDALIGENSKSPALRRQSRHQLFPQVLRIVNAYIDQKVDFRGQDPRELGLQRYTDRVVGRVVDAIRPDDDKGEAPLLPILYRYGPTGSTADVDFKTTRACHSTAHSHINQMPMDTAAWEGSAAFYLEMGASQGVVRCYARNDGLNFNIPYDYYGISHRYEPDFLVKLVVDAADPARDVTVIVEVKGFETDQDRAKYQAAKRWVRAVNNWGEMGQWAFHVSRDPQMLLRELTHLRKQWTAETAAEPAPAQIDNVRATATELPKAWRASINVAPECEDFLLRCYQAGLPLPEVGYETRDRRRHQAELAWETLNVAVFLAEYAQDKPAFAQAGWHTFMLNEADAAFDKLVEKDNA